MPHKQAEVTLAMPCKIIFGTNLFFVVGEEMDPRLHIFIVLRRVVRRNGVTAKMRRVTDTPGSHRDIDIRSTYIHTYIHALLVSRWHAPEATVADTGLLRGEAAPGDGQQPVQQRCVRPEDVTDQRQPSGRVRSALK